MDSLHRLANGSSGSLVLFPVAILSGLLIVSSQSAFAEIVFGTGTGAVTPAPGTSVAAQTARDVRQRAMLERARGDVDEGSRNVIVIDGYNPLGGINGLAAPGSPAANSAAYNRMRANESRVFLGDNPPAQPVVGVPAVNTGNYYGSPAEQSASSNRERANVYRQRGD